MDLSHTVAATEEFPEMTSQPRGDHEAIPTVACCRMIERGLIFCAQGLFSTIARIRFIREPFTSDEDGPVRSKGAHRKL